MKIPIKKLVVADDGSEGKVVLTPGLLKKAERYAKTLGLYKQKAGPNESLNNFGAHAIIGLIAYSMVCPQNKTIALGDMDKCFKAQKVLLKKVVDKLNECTQPSKETSI